MKLGRTIAGGREVSVSDFERQELLKQRERKKKIQLTLLGGVIMATIVSGYWLIREAIQEVPVVNQRTQGVDEKYMPTVEIIDEDGSNFITERMKQFVGMMEKDAKDSGLKVVKAIIPAGKAREIDVYFDGEEEFYKCNLDRGTAESTEDILRMMNFIKQKGLKVAYVDVRIEGRAYYKNK